jgi:hypothetical protein
MASVEIRWRRAGLSVSGHNDIPDPRCQRYRRSLERGGRCPSRPAAVPTRPPRSPRNPVCHGWYPGVKDLTGERSQPSHAPGHTRASESPGSACTRSSSSRWSPSWCRAPVQPIYFLWVHGSRFVALALLIAVVGAILLTLILGTARITQPRCLSRRHMARRACRVDDSGQPTPSRPAMAHPSTGAAWSVR